MLQINFLAEQEDGEMLLLVWTVSECHGRSLLDALWIAAGSKRAILPILSAAVCVAVSYSAIEVLQGGPQRAGITAHFGNYYTDGSICDKVCVCVSPCLAVQMFVVLLSSILLPPQT